ncbi:hypothetical protein H6CHR_04857 [Variovorax sp. PBL-H6]|uniref:hypothetical protein n=1 Tax=Variovorax sp. PBL-H6 TaxID=434009 RepID=UPI001318DEAD|nr:hypothetical protein [Variovorax sp. PBL-H6]VTU37036.1 hypothetical protein H6CHR_04857 [Variovorax sp. PBL-H6]
MSSPAPGRSRQAAAVVSAWLIVLFAKLLTGVRGVWTGTGSKAEQTLYFANHTSHGDFVLLWATLHPELRALTRPVAGQDYREASPLRRFIGREVFNALMIRRDGSAVRYGAPIALAEGEDKAPFIARARAAMLDLRPEYDRAED